jgi:hypothetical protein
MGAAEPSHHVRPADDATAITHVAVLPMNADTVLHDHTVIVRGERTKRSPPPP